MGVTSTTSRTWTSSESPSSVPEEGFPQGRAGADSGFEINSSKSGSSLSGILRSLLHGKASTSACSEVCSLISAAERAKVSKVVSKMIGASDSDELTRDQITLGGGFS